MTGLQVWTSDKNKPYIFLRRYYSPLLQSSFQKVNSKLHEARALNPYTRNHIKPEKNTIFPENKTSDFQAVCCLTLLLRWMNPLLCVSVGIMQHMRSCSLCTGIIRSSERLQELVSPAARSSRARGFTVISAGSKSEGCSATEGNCQSSGAPLHVSGSLWSSFSLRRFSPFAR